MTIHNTWTALFLMLATGRILLSTSACGNDGYVLLGVGDTDTEENESSDTTALLDAGSDEALSLTEFVFTEGAEEYASVHAPSLLELEDGTLLVAFLGGSNAGADDVEAWVARKSPGGAWTVPEKATDDDVTLHDPVLFQPRGGEVMLFFKSPDINTGNMVTSGDGGLTWSAPTPLPDGIVGPTVNKPVQLDDGTVISGSSTQEDGESGWRVHVERSIDNGENWTKIGPLNGEEWNVIQPTILVHSDGRLQLLMRSGSDSDENRIPTTWSEDNGVSWSALSNTSLPNNNSAIDAVTLKDGRHLLVYNHSTREAAGTGEKGRGILNVAVSGNGIDWEAALVLDYRDDDSRFTYPAVIQTADGVVHVAYTWNRERIKHVAIDPDALVTYPMVSGEWPTDKVPWIVSEE